MADFQRDKTGQRLDFAGIDLVHPVDLLPPGKVPYALNVRRYIKGGIQGRNLLTAPVTVQSPNSASSITGTVSQTGAGQAWTNPANIISNSVFASVAVGGSNPTSSQILEVQGMGFSVPGTATITGIQFSFFCPSTSGVGLTANVQPLSGASLVGTITPIILTSGSGTKTVGGIGQLLGFAWTPANVNAGLGFSVYVASPGPTSSGATSFNQLEVTVYYTNSAPLTVTGSPHTIRRLNDSTPNGPASGYALVIGAAGSMYVNTAQVASGLSGNPVSLIPFRPNASVQPDMYVGDSSQAVTITANGFACTGMLKIRSDGQTQKMGIAEPQLAPVVSTSNSSITTTGTLAATDIPWTNFTGQNSGYNYGESNGAPHPISGRDGTPPFIVDCANASFITITSLTGTATINGGSHAPSDSNAAWVAPGSPSYPGQFIQIAGTGLTPSTASVVIGAFTDGAGNVVAKGVAPLFIPSVVDVGAVIGVTNAIQVPFGAVDFQIGINSVGNTYSSNSGSFAISVTVTTNALPAVTSILGTLSLSYFDDSPTSGPTGSYIWKNPDDPGGSGPVRSITDAIGTTTGNSFIFDATFSSGLPGLPGIGSPTVPMLWTDLDPNSVAIGSNPVFAAPLTRTNPTNTQFANFNFCLSGNIYFPSSGNFTFVLTNHDDLIWGIGGGVTLVSATVSGVGEGSSATLSGYGQTITVVNGYPLLPRQRYTSGSGGNYAKTTVVVSVPAAGIYPIEVDFDYWYHSGRILLVMGSPASGGSPTIIPPLPATIRQEVQYRYVYRNSGTGAVSNPSPESTAETIPVTANTITSLWSPDPQVDVVDYYRIDSVTADFTYVNTGPNDNLGGGGTNTPVTDSLLDTELGTQLLQFDNFEPFPSIDLPQKGILNSSGGVLTWVSGGAIGGSQTGFNIRWLAGTEILIGSPTSLAYTFIARPTSATTVVIPGVPDGDNLAYEIPEPILAAQPLPYLFGPTDNINFTFGVGDPLRAGTLYWCKGSNLDSAPDTNQLDVTDPGEPLVNGAMSNGRGVVFSIKRAWVIMPNFFNALATVTGTTGSTWTLQDTAITRGLFMPRCLAIDGGGNIFFRVNDGIHISAAGGESKSITDEDLYPLFPHESADGGTSIPQPVTLAGNTIYPPNDSQPQAQRFSIQGAYLYWDYIGTDSQPHTFVFDIAAMGWVPDSYQWPATIHAANEDTSTTGTLVGCNDGSVRQLATGATGIEVATAVFLTRAEDFGDTRGTKKVADVYIESENP